MLNTHASLQENSPWSTTRIARLALFCALAMAVSYIEIPLFPLAPYLKYDPSTVICALVALYLGLRDGMWVSVLMWTPHFFTNPFGAIMGVVATVSFVLPLKLLSKKSSKYRMIIALVLSSVCMIVFCILGNLVVTPLYTTMPLSAVINLIIPILLPFNLIKVVLNSAIIFALNARLQKFLTKLLVS